MPRKLPRRAVEALHRAIQHHIAVEPELAKVHKALARSGPTYAAVESIRAKSEHLALGARLLSLLSMLKPEPTASREWRLAQLRRVERESR